MEKEGQKDIRRSFEDVKNMIAELKGLFAEINTTPHIRAIGRFPFPNLGIDLVYNNRDCNASCSTNCSGCSACSGCDGCDNTSTSTSKFAPNENIGRILQDPRIAQILAEIAPK